MTRYDIAVVGAGILGLAHALHAARAGLSVVVFERAARARGASVRNFGMLALIAQAEGRQRASAERSLTTWREMATSARIEIDHAGCLFLARLPEEMAVLEEFAPVGTACELLSSAALDHRATGLQSEVLLGGLWSTDAWKVDQRNAMSRIGNWLSAEHGVAFHFDTEVLGVDPPAVETSAGRFEASHVVVCGGNEFATLFPEAFRSTGVTTCKLQMLRTRPQPSEWRLKPFLLGGLSLTRYDAFADCPSLPELRARQQRDRARHLAHGIHLIACQETDGSVTIGDSHAYGDNPGPERSDQIDRLILEDLAGMIALPDPRIGERWLGHYAHLPGEEVLRLTPAEGVTAVTMTNGQGMTHGFAVAEELIGEIAG